MNGVYAVNTGRNSRGQGLQKFRPPGQPLLTWSANGALLTKTAQLVVPVPDSRLRVKIGVLFIPIAGFVPAVPGDTGAASLWLYEADADEMFTGGEIPTNNIEGTSLAPTVIPEGNGLYGYSREFWSAGDYIKGTLVSTNAPEGGGTWTLQCSCQPDTGQRFTDEEWQEVTAKFSPRAIGWQAF